MDSSQFPRIYDNSDSGFTEIDQQTTMSNEATNGNQTVLTPSSLLWGSSATHSQIIVTSPDDLVVTKTIAPSLMSSPTSVSSGSSISDEQAESSPKNYQPNTFNADQENENNEDNYDNIIKMPLYGSVRKKSETDVEELEVEEEIENEEEESMDDDDDESQISSLSAWVSALNFAQLYLFTNFSPTSIDSQAN